MTLYLVIIPTLSNPQVKITKLESAVDMAQQDRDHVIGHLETEKGLSKKYKEELERMKKEFLEHQRVCEKYAG